MYHVEFIADVFPFGRNYNFYDTEFSHFISQYCSRWMDGCIDRWMDGQKFNNVDFKKVAKIWVQMNKNRLNNLTFGFYLNTLYLIQSTIFIL